MNLRGKRAIELGCGVGLPSVVALERGADEVVATDHYPGALDFAAYNAESNGEKSLETALLDWRKPRLDGLANFDIVFAADVLYERRNVPLLAEIVPKLLAPKGEIIFADPRRSGAKMFVEEMGRRGFRCSETRAAVEQGGREIGVCIHRFRSVRTEPGRAGNGLLPDPEPASEAPS
jgi:ribosomal protein L11 methylase PrmA